MKRSAPTRRARAHKENVPGLIGVLVIARDHEAMRKAGLMVKATIDGRGVQPVCIAPILDPDQIGQCWGRTTLDHIKSRPRLGVRAESDADHLVSLCQGHTEDGRRAGSQWNTANRPALRDYLASQTA